MKRAITMNQLYNTKRKVLDFQGEWKAFCGQPELKGSWLVYGHSGNGKTSFMVQISKYFAQLGLKVLYNSLEEGNCYSFELACRRESMESVSKRFHLVEESLEDIKIRLRKKRSYDVVIIDSVQHLGITYREFIKLLDEFKNKLFVFVSHAEGRHPEGRSAKKIKYASPVKIWVEGYQAVAVSRFGGGEPFIIWPEKVKELETL